MLYTHTQSIASKVWTIKHNLGSIPIVHTFTHQVINGVSTLADATTPPVTIIDDSNIILTFAEAVSGVAQLEALASRNTTSAQPTTIVAPSNTQVSTDVGDITIATLSDDPIISIVLAYLIPGANPYLINYNNIDTTADANSPWNGVYQVYINGTVYTVRNFNLITHPAALRPFVSGQIPPTGCPVMIQAVNDTTQNGVLLLEARAPFTSVDRTIDRYVDFGIETANSGNILYSYGKLYATPAAQKIIYPYISVV